jgi:hypothetical protein
MVMRKYSYYATSMYSMSVPVMKASTNLTEATFRNEKMSLTNDSDATARIRKLFGLLADGLRVTHYSTATAALHYSTATAAKLESYSDLQPERNSEATPR